MQKLFELYRDIASLQKTTTTNLKKINLKFQKTQRTIKFLQKNLNHDEIIVLSIRKQIEIERQKKIKYKNLKDEHKLKNNNLTKEVKSFRANNVTLKKKIRDLKVKIKHHDSQYIDDFDSKNNRRKVRFQKAREFNVLKTMIFIVFQS